MTRPVPSSMGFYRVISAAIADFAAHGFDSEARLERWIEAIRQATQKAMVSPDRMEQMLRDSLQSVYHRQVTEGGLIRTQNIQRYTLAQVEPKLRAELDRRILASSSLIKLNRKAMIERTLQRFSGWATSVPAGGSKATDKKDVSANVRKALAQLPFEERRVMIDQGHKLSAALGEITATNSGAIAMKWRSHWRQPGYQYREDHKERDEHIWAIRDNWAAKAGLMKPGPNGYYDAITSVGEEIFCRCWAVWIYSIRQLPDDMLTARGRMKLKGTAK